jgi:NitT/TauT family transport system permease protein
MTETKQLMQQVKKYGRKLSAVCFWLILWELLSLYLDSDILLASPRDVIATLFQLMKTLEFWRTILFSSLRIIIGFTLGMTAGIILAIISFRYTLVEELLSPMMKLIKTLPVASFIILALIWINSKNLSVLISLTMVLPMIYSNVLQGMREADEKLLQMAQIYGLGPIRKAVAIYVPAVTPFVITAVSVGIGFCWKAGVAAEVIGIPSGSIGERLYEAKLYLMTKELLAWTIVIIIISMIFEMLVLRLLRLPKRKGRL